MSNKADNEDFLVAQPAPALGLSSALGQAATREHGFRYFYNEKPQYFENRDMLGLSELGQFVMRIDSQAIEPSWCLALRGEAENKVVLEIDLTINRRYCKMLYQQGATALDYAQAFRTIWWHWRAERDVLPATSPEEYILEKRFLAADLEAISLGVLAQLVGHVSYKREYISALLDIQGPDVYQTLSHSYQTICKIGRTPKLLRQAMRWHFDRHIALSPLALNRDLEILQKLDSLYPTVKKIGPLGWFRRMTVEELTFPNAGVVRPEFVQSLAATLGVMDKNGSNYLTQTQGLNICDPFYTEIHNVDLERKAKQLQQRPARSRLACALARAVLPYPKMP